VWQSEVQGQARLIYASEPRDFEMLVSVSNGQPSLNGTPVEGVDWSKIGPATTRDDYDDLVIGHIHFDFGEAMYSAGGDGAWMTRRCMDDTTGYSHLARPSLQALACLERTYLCLS
jgi:hypothetical protein